MSDPSPLPPGQFTDNPYSAPGMPQHPQGYGQPYYIDPSIPRRGLVAQIPIVAILNAIQGFLELILAAMFVFMYLAFSFDNPNRNGNGEELMVFAIFGGFACVFGICAIMRFVSSYMIYKYSSRTFAIISLCFGLITVFTFYCAPTSIGIAIYGLIVLLNPPVKEAFEMKKAGQTPEQITAHFNSRPW
jgi:hypothetical protein